MSKIIIKVSKDANLISNILKCKVYDIFQLNDLMHHFDKINIDDFVLLVVGGDHSKKEIAKIDYKNGLKAIAKISKTPNLNGNHYSVEIKIIYVFDNTITKNNLYIYPQLKDIPNIGGSTKGVKNQAVSIIDDEEFENILKAIIDFKPTTKREILNIYNCFSNNTINKYSKIENLKIV
ncbi:hypothetical protein [Aliarcobacter butzleri]|uniref:hypothetical protein n=1 Tax=Aliarcobacter butzleri TaxID=28197 RepID=UPI001261383A|nr:hypothetical protein [Aliarcobacter butzleri]